MTKTLFIKPAAGLLIRDPETREHLKPEGEDKPDTRHWRRLLLNGDVVEARKPRPGAASGAAAKRES